MAQTSWCILNAFKLGQRRQKTWKGYKRPSVAVVLAPFIVFRPSPPCPGLIMFNAMSIGFYQTYKFRSPMEAPKRTIVARVGFSYKFAEFAA